MSKKSILAAISMTALLAMAPAAFAADAVIEEAPVPAPVEVEAAPTWSGVYAGINAGYGFGDFETPSGDIDADGASVGAYAGFNLQAGQVVYGVEGDVGYSFLEGAAGAVTAEQGFNGAVRGRLGYAIDPVLLYAAGGLAVTNAEANDGAFSDSNTHIGWTAGAGAEAFVTQSVIGRVEYRYNDFGEETYSLTAPTEVGLKSHEIRFGVGLKF
jgi:outer membrane immunogenic protein